MIIPATMRQAIFNGAGGPEVVQIETAPVPQPGPDQVLIAVEAAGINRPDCIQRSGKYPPPPGATAIPGLEVAGTVVALGAGTDMSLMGAKVCALLVSGGYAEFAVADAALCLPIPQPLSMLEAGGVPETYFTVYDNVFTRGQLKRGETILIHGGSSGIGSTAIQLAKHAGSTVYTTVGSDEKAAFCRTLGADHVINYRTDDFADIVRGLTAKRGVDVILDMVGGAYIPKNVASLALDGRLVQIAFLQGSKAELDFTAMMVKRLTLTGSTLRPRSVAQKAVIATKLRSEVWPLLDSGTVKPIVHKVFPLAQAREAHALMESSAHLGKIMLDMRAV
ncbi:MAG: NAD(P)H-quinone oxidoreductase [Beijerinckiaceae bacterium]